MSATLERTPVVINYEATCVHDSCDRLTTDMYLLLKTSKYSRGVSLLPVPETLKAWRAEHRTARKRADYAMRHGYRFARVDYSQHSDDMHAINTSKVERQGRPMSEGYLKRVTRSPLPEYPCERHYIRTYGVLQCDVLLAYLSLYRLGELAMVSMILGHGDHLENRIMYLLFQGVVEDQAGRGGFFYYNRHDSGKDNDLVFYKERQGFGATDVEWVLQ